MQTQTSFDFALLKLILDLFSAAPVLPLIPLGGPTPKSKKLFLRLSICDDEL